MEQKENQSLKQDPLPGLANIKVEEKKKKRVHPQFGEYVDVTVVPLMQIDMKNTGHVSVGTYTADYKYNVKQAFPELIVQFIEERTETKRRYETHFDEDKRPYEKMIVEKTPRFNVIRH